MSEHDENDHDERDNQMSHDEIVERLHGMGAKWDAEKQQWGVPHTALPDLLYLVTVQMDANLEFAHVPAA